MLREQAAITMSLSCSKNNKLWLHFTIQTSAGIYLVPLNHLLEAFLRGRGKIITLSLAPYVRAKILLLLAIFGDI